MLWGWWGVPKKRTSVTVDEDVLEQLQAREDINVSGLVNRMLRDYVQGDESERAVLEARVERLEDDVADLEQQLKQKRSQLEDARNQLEAYDNRKQNELERELEDYTEIPADPTHKEIIRIASDFNTSTTEVAQKHAELTGKEVQINDRY